MQILYYQASRFYDHYRETSQGLWLREAQNTELQNLKLASAEDTVVLLPSQLIRLFQLHLPKMSNQQLRKAIPFALEDQLIDPLENLHFTLAHTHQNRQTVAVIDKTLLEAILQELSSITCLPTALIPDCLILPLKDDCMTMYLGETHSVIRKNAYEGFAIQKDLLIPLLKQQLGHCEKNLLCTIFGRQLPDLSALPCLQTELVHSTELPIDNTWLEAPALNLLQGPYKGKKVKRKNRIHGWWMAFGSVFSFLMVSILFKVITFAILHHKNTLIDEQALAQYRLVFPSATALVEPEAALAQTLETLKSAENSHPFFKLLTQLIQTINHNPNLQLLTLKYQDNQLIINVSGNQLSVIEQMAQQLEQQGLQVSQNHVTPGVHRVSALLTITRKTT